MRYGAADRFLPPRPVAWAGVRDALRFGPRAPQIDRPTQRPHLTWLRDAGAWSEDCLVLNVFAPALDTTAQLPVMVYVHGGGFAIGGAGSPGLEGGGLARRGVVLVSVHHRLNLFGHLHLGDGPFEESGNAGILDIVAALGWVKANIAGFGGDPSNVTVFGQSGGASKVAALMATPRAHGLFHKAIIQSASSLLAFATPEQAERNAHQFLSVLGLGRGDIARLRNMPAQMLLDAMPLAVRTAGRIDNYRPVVDGRTIVSQPFDAPAVALSGHVQLMIGWCENEQRLTFAADPAIYRQREAEAVAATARVLGVEPPDAVVLVAAYRRGRPSDFPGDVYAQIYGDHRYRRSVTAAAEAHAASGGPTWMYLLDWKTPVLDGLLRTPHTLCLAFVFGNVAATSGISGEGADRFALQERMTEAWIAFARTGRPDHPGLPLWPTFSAADRQTMVFGWHTRVENDPLAEERRAFRTLSALRPRGRRGHVAVGVGMRRLGSDACPRNGH